MFSPDEVWTAICSTGFQKEWQEGLLLLNSHGNIIHANESAASFFNLAPQKLTGTSFLSLFNRRERRLLSERLRDPPTTPLRYLLTREVNSTIRTYALTMHPVRERERIKLIVVTLHDFTRIEQLQQERDRSLDRERTCIESISHHFFNPLAIAKGYLQLAQEESDNGSEAKLRAASEALDRIEEVVKTIIRTGNLDNVK